VQRSDIYAIIQLVSGKGRIGMVNDKKMKFFIPALVIIGTILVVISLVFSAQIMLNMPASALVKNSTSSSLTTNTQTVTNTSATAPAGFRGPPAGQAPYVKGPTSNPPNY